jgi:N-acetylmuramoyl-L-alanine amidase
MRIEHGILIPDSGDPAVHVMLRAKDYGAMLSPGAVPLLGVNHVTGSYAPVDPTTPRQDGTAGIAARVAAGARYYAHLELSRDGTLWQNLPLHRCAIHCEHSWKDLAGKLWEINRVAVGMEWAGCGWIRQNGCMPGKSGIDLTRPDLKLSGHLYWQIPTPQQIDTAGRVWQAVHAAYGMAPENLVHGHGELAHGGHELCPGPFILEALHNVILPLIVGEPAPEVFYEAPALAFDGPLFCEAPADVFAEHGFSLTDDELPRYFSPDEIERYVRSGALTHDDESAQMSTLAWHWDQAAYEAAGVGV